MQKQHQLIKARGIFDHNNGVIDTEKCILVKDEHIVSVDTLENLQQHVDQAPLEIIDLSDRYIFPGLCNTHVHLTFSASSEPLKEYFADNEIQRVIRAVVNARKALRSGVTTIRDCGSGWELLSLGRMVRENIIEIPRLILCGPPVTPTGGHLHFMGGEVDGIEEIRKGIRQRQKRGVSSIKIIATGGQMTQGTFPEKPSFWQEELDAAVKEAEVFGFPTVAHCLSDEGTLRAIRAGIDSIDHCAFFVRECHGWLERCYNHEVALELRDSGNSFMMGLSAGYHTHDAYRDGKPPTAKERFLLEQEKRMLEIFVRLVDLGIPPVVGTDAGVTLTPFHETYLELVLMKKAGLSSLETIKAATSTAAQVLGVEKEIGTIAAGFYADVIAVPNNPLEDVSAFKEVDWVMHKGKIVRDDYGGKRI